MEDFINTSFNDILSTLETTLPVEEQSAAGINVLDPFGPLGLNPEIYDSSENEITEHPTVKG